MTKTAEKTAAGVVPSFECHSTFCNRSGIISLKKYSAICYQGYKVRDLVRGRLVISDISHHATSSIVNAHVFICLCTWFVTQADIF